MGNRRGRSDHGFGLQLMAFEASNAALIWKILPSLMTHTGCTWEALPLLFVVSPISLNYTIGKDVVYYLIMVMTIVCDIQYRTLWRNLFLALSELFINLCHQKYFSQLWLAYLRAYLRGHISYISFKLYHQIKFYYILRWVKNKEIY